MHPRLGVKEVPSPSHILDTLEANPSLDKSLWEDITPPMMDSTMGWGKNQSKTRLDRLENLIYDLDDNKEALC